jgi:hypothetical protein
LIRIANKPGHQVTRDPQLFHHFAVNDFALLSSPATFHLSPFTIVTP